MLSSLKRMAFFLAMYQLLPNFFTSTSSCECSGKAQNSFAIGRCTEYSEPQSMNPELEDIWEGQDFIPEEWILCMMQKLF